MTSRMRKGLLVAAAAAILLAPLASPLPDGLERAAEDLGLMEHAASRLPAPFPDYLLPGLGSGPLSTIAAGLLGVGLATLAALGLGRLLRRG
ncbi:PDGLE domain-containing protein [Limnochorda pilosa]|uniref:Membrane protein n=1 Tax=Limnochorda pilosa TaxID=1555112 RepID=A0A0K2SI16_LIMPI|nr:PDGLE domain-containing protein [Limnochorda pilosa]BAS26494.1 membrane protein [Limnochorda pilosa]